MSEEYDEVMQGLEKRGMKGEDYEAVVEAIARINAANLEDAADTRDAAGLCASYRRVRGSLEKLSGVLGFIPMYGAPAAAGMKLLMVIADNTCPSTGTETSSEEAPEGQAA